MGQRDGRSAGHWFACAFAQLCLDQGVLHMRHAGTARGANSHMGSNPNRIKPTEFSIRVKENLLVGDVNEFSNHSYNSSARINRARDRVSDIETEPSEMPRVWEISR